MAPYSFRKCEDELGKVGTEDDSTKIVSQLLNLSSQGTQWSSQYLSFRAVLPSQITHVCFFQLARESRGSRCGASTDLGTWVWLVALAQLVIDVGPNSRCLGSLDGLEGLDASQRGIDNFLGLVEEVDLSRAEVALVLS